MNLNNCATETAILFLNGEYWGIYSLRERYDRHYLENNNGINSKEVDILVCGSKGFDAEEGTTERYDAFTNNLENYDFQSEAYLSYLNEYIDLDNLTDLLCAQFYLANLDFPINNLKIWNARNDTSKWRFFFFDLDGAMIQTNYDHLSEYDGMSGKDYKYPDHSDFNFWGLIHHPVFMDRFNARLLKHLRTTFSPDRVIEKINHYEDLYRPLVSENAYRWNTPVDYNKWIHNIGSLRLFALQRPAVIFNQLADHSYHPFAIFPNPATGFFRIDFFDSEENADIDIFSSTGQLVHSQHLAGSERVSLHSGLKSGLYLIQVKLRQNVYHETLMILN
jgi:hypothetical protein